MPFDVFVDLDTLCELRRRAVRASLRSVSSEEAHALCQEIYRYPGDACGEAFLRLILDQPHGSFYHAVTHDHFVFIYCRNEEIGLWFLPGTGMGPLRDPGRSIMIEAIEHRF